MRIGAVLDLLRSEFPDVSISKIRFLEAQGLLEPDRTRAGYRVYSTGDVERLRYILTAQRDRFWPLKVIAEALEGGAAVVVALGVQLADSSGCAPATIDSLLEFGLIQPDPTGHFGTEQAQVAAAAGALTAFGLEPRHLRAFRAAADREVGLVEQALATHADPGDRERAAGHIAHACLQLHAALVKAGLRRH